MAKTPKTTLLAEILRRGLLATEQEIIAHVLAGKVVVDDQRVNSAHLRIPTAADIRIKNLAPFVSRGGAKLHGFLRDHDLTSWVRDGVVLDVGASTGGFTDCCLQLGAKKVYAVDVGTHQLDWKLRDHPDVIVMERTDVRSLTMAAIPDVSFVCCDVSFLPLSAVIPALFALGLPEGTGMALLVKPQFELPPEQVPEGGVVTDEVSRQQALDECLDLIAPRSAETPLTSDSTVAGRRGNREMFVAFRLKN